MHPLFELLTKNGPAITDGALGTQLQARGLAAGDCPEAWNLDRPADVEAVARAYVDAGSDLILTPDKRYSCAAFVCLFHLAF